KRRATLVNEATLADVARQWNLQDYLRLGQGELASEGKHKSSILSSALEAVLGAVFLDGGLVAVTPVVERLMGDRLDRVKENLRLMNKDFKTLLQEAIQNKYKTVPKYEIDSTQGPEHRKEFKVSVYIQERKLGEGKGLSRKEAEQNAAQSALEKGNL
ncbi:MAG: ribonuclease III, partial [Oligoflexia bacterium]|nr:ribonuclease III [Oligoflexia bacterium]